MIKRPYVAEWLLYNIQCSKICRNAYKKSRYDFKNAQNVVPKIKKKLHENYESKPHQTLAQLSFYYLYSCVKIPAHNINFEFELRRLP